MHPKFKLIDPTQTMSQYLPLDTLEDTADSPLRNAKVDVCLTSAQQSNMTSEKQHQDSTPNSLLAQESPINFQRRVSRRASEKVSMLSFRNEAPNVNLPKLPDTT
jgi:hypothetical protein